MRITDEIALRMPRRSPARPPIQAPVPAQPAPVAQPAPSDELRRRRDGLARRFAELQWDLGGIAYEMASREHFRLDVLTRQAAKLQEVDAELAGIERMMRLGDAAAAGNCPSCGALFARGAAFCWSCGTTLIEPTVDAEAPTTVNAIPVADGPA